MAIAFTAIDLSIAKCFRSIPRYFRVGAAPTSMLAVHQLGQASTTNLRELSREFDPPIAAIRSSKQLAVMAACQNKFGI